MRTLLYLLAGYLLLVGFVFVVQRNMLYFPDPAPPAIEAVRLGGGMTLEPWPAGHPAFRGYAGEGLPEGSPVRGTVVVFHGNAGGARDRIYYWLALEARGYRVVLAEYPGYGGRDGELGEDSFVRDGRETARRALAEFGGPLLDSSFQLLAGGFQDLFRLPAFGDVGDGAHITHDLAGVIGLTQCLAQHPRHGAIRPLEAVL